MHRKPTGCIAQILGYTKSPYIAPFFFLVVETFRRNVSTKFCKRLKKGSRLGFGIIATDRKLRTTINSQNTLLQASPADLS
jgi:hypothetical protein